MDGDSMDVDGPSYVVLNEDHPMPQAAPISLLKKRAYDEFAQGHRERAPVYFPIRSNRAKYRSNTGTTFIPGLSPAPSRSKLKFRTSQYERGSIPPLFRGCPQPSPFHSPPRILRQSPKQLRELAENVARINHPVRRIGGMVTTICTIGISIIASAWNYFTGAEPTNIIAVETDSTGSKRRAIEVVRPTAQDITPKVPGSYIQSPQDSYPKHAGQSPSALSFRRVSDLSLGEKEDSPMEDQPSLVPKTKNSATHQAPTTQKYKQLNEPMFSPSAQPKQTGAASQSAMQSISQPASQPSVQPKHTGAASQPAMQSVSQPASQPASQPSVQPKHTGAASQAATQPATKSASYFPLRWPLLSWQSSKPAASSSESAQPLQSGAAPETETTSPKDVQPLQSAAASKTESTPQKGVQPLQSGAAPSLRKQLSPYLRDSAKEAAFKDYDWEPGCGWHPNVLRKRDFQPWYLNFTGDIPNGKTVAEQEAEREAAAEAARESAWHKEMYEESERWEAEEWQRRQDERAEKRAKAAAEHAWFHEQREAQDAARAAALEKKRKDKEDYINARAALPMDQRPNANLPKPMRMLITPWEEDFEFLSTPPPFKPEAWEEAKRLAMRWGNWTHWQNQAARDAETDAQRAARKAEGRTKYHDLPPEELADIWLAAHHNETWMYYMEKDTRARERAKVTQAKLQKEALAKAQKEQADVIARLKAQKAQLAAEQAKEEEERLRIEAEEKAAKQLKREQKKAEKAEKARLEQVRLEQEAEQARLEQEAEKARIQAEREAEQAKLKAAEEAKEEARLAKELEDKAKVAEAKPVDPEWLKKQQLVRPLDPEWAEKIDQAMAAKSKDTIVATTVDGTEISRHDLESLIRKPGVKSQPWLNDEIVNGIMAAIVGRKLEQTGWAKGSKTAPAYAYLPSMWYSNYQKPGGVNNIASWTRRRGIKGAKLLEAEKVFFPVNTGVHWMLLIISPQARTIEFLDSFNFGLHSKAWMFQIAREWLAMELEGKYVAEEWTELASESCPQSNSDDCGAFTCFNALAAGKGLGFEAVGGGHMADARKMLAAVLVNGGFKGDFEL